MNLQFDPRAIAKKAPAYGAPTPSAAPGEPQPLGENRGLVREDRVELSQEALEYVRDQEQAAQPEQDQPPEPLSPEEQRRLAQQEKLKMARQMLEAARQQSVQMQEQSKKQTDALKEQMDKMKKCAKIARSISKGHKVPPKDEKYLLENDLKAYMMAMALRMMSEQDNKKVKSVLDKEDGRQEEGASEAGAPEAIGPEAAPEAEGAAE